MDDTIISVKPRSLVGRIFPWAASLGLFAGGGYGVYHFAVPQKDASAAQDAAAVATADDDSSFAAFASRNNPFTGPRTEPTSQPTYGGRYGSPTEPSLPPEQDAQEVATPRSAVAVSPAASSAAAPQSERNGNRYASGATADPFAAQAAAAAAAPTDTAEEPANESAAAVDPADEAPTTADASTPDVTRGQEPDSGNPLRNPSAGPARSAQAASAAPADDAQAAFGESSRAPKPLNLGVATRTPADPAASQAPAPALPATGDSRYAASARQPKPAAADAQDYPADAADAFPLAPRTESAAASAPQPRPTAPAFGYGAQPTPAEPGIAGQLPAQPQVAFNDSPGAGAVNSAIENSVITPTPGLAAADGTGRPGERILEGAQSPALTVQKLAPPEIQVGKKCTFAIRVHNSSPRTAHNVQVTDEVPLGTQLVGAAPRATVNGAQVRWDLGTLSAGEERVVEMELIPTDEGELGSVATVTFAAQASAKARCTRPQLALRLTANPRVMIGQQQLVEVEISNPGSGDATGVMLLESVPQGVTHEAGPALEFEIGMLPAGESRRLELVLNAEQAGTVNNVMTAKADANLQVQAACQFEVIAPDLKVTIDGPKNRYLERPATYTVNVDNPGTASAKEVQLVTQLPRGMQFVSANNMGEYDPATHSVYWSLAELPANERGSVELTALPIEPGEHTLQIATRAQQGLEDRAETRVTVEGLVALGFEVTAADGAIEVGGETNYEIRVVNQGSKAATNVQVVAIMPPGLRAMSGQGETRHVVDGNRVAFAPLAQLAPKAEAQFRVQVQGLRPGDQRARVQITTDEVQEPITKEQSTRVYADE